MEKCDLFVMEKLDPTSEHLCYLHSIELLFTDLSVNKAENIALAPNSMPRDAPNDVDAFPLSDF